MHAGPNRFREMLPMKITLKGLAIILGCASIASAAGPGTLTTLHAIHALSKAEAAKGLPVAFEATVTYYNKSDVDLFVQDGNEAIYVETKPNQNLVPGDRVLVRGKTRNSFTPDVLSDNVTRIQSGNPPKPVAADFESLIRAELDCMRVTVHATIRSADLVNFGTMPVTYLKLIMDGGSIDATVNSGDASKLKGMLDAEAEVTGVVSGKFDNKNQLTGILLEVPTLADVKILKPAQTDPDSLPLTPMDQVLSTYSFHDLTRRVRVQGTITYFEPGSAVVLQDGAKSLWISTHSSGPFRIGDRAEATGFPDGRSSYLALTDGRITDSHIYQPVAPQPSTWRQMATWNSGDPNGHQNDLVSIEGKVAAEVREESQDEFVLDSDGKLITAIYYHPPTNGPLPQIERVPLGGRIRVTGICMVVQVNTVNPGEQEVPFNLLLRSFDDVEVIAQPSLLNVRNLALLVAFLFALVFAVGSRGLFIERSVRRQNASLAYIESRRSRILEDINGSRPLAEIVEQITELVSYKLKGAPCWCQITDGATLGNAPAKLTAFRIAQREISARSGPALGVIFAALDPLTSPQPSESEALSMAAALSALAIETRSLYTDLRRRSEFDLLTDTHNRFSLDKHLEVAIVDARIAAGVFGLIYIDLDEFKQINDVHGHHFGDRYLQEVAVRMKRQLRAHDLLARQGGDEFAVLVPVVHSRAQLEEIASRLERCLDDPLIIEGHTIAGSASVGIALYPEDGNTKEALLNHADAAMYRSKHSAR